MKGYIFIVGRVIYIGIWAAPGFPPGPYNPPNYVSVVYTQTNPGLEMYGTI